MKNKFLAKASTFVAAIAAPGMVMAADVTSWTEHLGKQMTSAKEFALAIAFMIGLFLFIAGLYGLYKDSKQPGQDHAKKGMISLAIGTLLLIVPTVIAIAGGTFDAAGDEKTVTTIKSNTW
jgi:predicted transporter